MRTILHASLRWSVFAAGVLAVPFAAAVTPAELSARLAQNENILVVDVRSVDAYTAGHIPGAVNIPLSLLPYKRLPAASLIAICGDGLGFIDESKAVSVVSNPTGSKVEVVVGGFAAWLAQTRMTTAAGGVVREQIPGITYDKLVTAAKGDVVMIDLRDAAPEAMARTQPAGADTGASGDVVAAFAVRLGVPLAKAHPIAVASKLHAQMAGATAANVLESFDHSGKLLVLVADNEAEASAAARQLRARGNYRFTILIGGTDAIRHEGRIGSGRLSGGTYAGDPQP